MNKINRKARRAEAARARKKTTTAWANIRHIVAMHESGHAVARYLTAPELGFSCEDSIAIIKIHAADRMPLVMQSKDGEQIASQATTFGHVFSKEIAAYYVPHDGEIRKEDIVNAAKVGGADIQKWLRARGLIAVMGAVAEGALTGETVDNLLCGGPTFGDLANLWSDYNAAKMLGSFDAGVEDAITRAIELLQRPKVIRALNALSRHLYENGTTDGKTAAAIIHGELDDMETVCAQ